MKKSANAGNTRETYLRFNVSDFANIAGATLRLFGKSSTSTQNVPLSVYGVSNATWSETGVTWNNKPAAGDRLAPRRSPERPARGTSSTSATYVQQQRAAGATAVTFVLKATSVDGRAGAVQQRRERRRTSPQLVR